MSFSSKHFYDGQLQAIKVRSKPVREVIRFDVLEPGDADGVKNTDRTEAEFILKELRRTNDEGADLTWE